MRLLFSTILCLSCALAIACAGKTGPENQTANTAASGQNANAGVQNPSAPPSGASQTATAAAGGQQGASSAPSAPSGAADSAGPSAPTLKGAYAIKEVHKDGVITILTQVTTVINFYQDGTYSRSAMKGKHAYHTDAGNYRIEGNQLTLMTTMGGGKIHNPPRESKHTFTLSADGSELRLTSSKGNIAVFQRTQG
jgi:hypothetical protein